MRNNPIPGVLEIDHARGVIYFHRSDTGTTMLRISRLGTIPKKASFIDVTAHPFGETTEGTNYEDTIVCAEASASITEGQVPPTPTQPEAKNEPC